MTHLQVGPTFSDHHADMASLAMLHHHAKEGIAASCNLSGLGSKREASTGVEQFWLGSCVQQLSRVYAVRSEHCLHWCSQAATDEYIEQEDARFQQAAEMLVRGLGTAPKLAASSVASSLRLGEAHNSLSGKGLFHRQMSCRPGSKLACFMLEKATAFLFKTRKEAAALEWGWSKRNAII